MSKFFEIVVFAAIASILVASQEALAFAPQSAIAVSGLQSTRGGIVRPPLDLTLSNRIGVTRSPRQQHSSLSWKKRGRGQARKPFKRLNGARKPFKKFAEEPKKSKIPNIDLRQEYAYWTISLFFMQSPEVCFKFVFLPWVISYVLELIRCFFLLISEFRLDNLLRNLQNHMQDAVKACFNYSILAVFGFFQSFGILMEWRDLWLYQPDVFQLRFRSLRDRISGRSKFLKPSLYKRLKPVLSYGLIIATNRKTVWKSISFFFFRYFVRVAERSREKFEQEAREEHNRNKQRWGHLQVGLSRCWQC